MIKIFPFLKFSKIILNLFVLCYPADDSTYRKEDFQIFPIFSEIKHSLFPKFPRQKLLHLIFFNSFNKLLKFNLTSLAIASQSLPSHISYGLFIHTFLWNHFLFEHKIKSETKIVHINFEIFIPIIHSKQKLTLVFFTCVNMKRC